MKKLFLMMLFSASCYSQNATVSFFYGTENTLVAELLVHVKNTESFYIGGGYGGVLNQNRQSKEPEKWCDIYAVSSFGYIGPVMVKYKTGLSVYNVGRTEVDYKPLIGIGAMYSINENYGIEAGFDTFNEFTIGFCVIF